MNSFSCIEYGPSGLIQCQESESYYYFSIIQTGDFYDASFTACNECTTDAICVSLANGAVYINQGICTIPCTGVSECSGIKFEANNSQATSLDSSFTCESYQGKNYCAAQLADTSTGSGGGCNSACLDTCTVGESCLLICCN